MKISKLLNKNFFLIIFFLIIGTNSYTEEKPVDIWNIDKEQMDENSLSNPSAILNENQTKTITETNIYDMQSQKQLNQIKLDENINSKEIKIIGLYDPEDHGLDINMWLNSNGDQLKNIFSKLEKIELSDDASEIMNISLLTNSYMPNKNITDKDFLRFKSKWLMKDSNLNLIEDYLIKNQIINLHPKLTKYLVDKYLSQSNLKKSCEIFSKNMISLEDEYLSKFNLYCLVYKDKKDQAQLMLDLKILIIEYPKTLFLIFT